MEELLINMSTLGKAQNRDCRDYDDYDYYPCRDYDNIKTNMTDEELVLIPTKDLNKVVKESGWPFNIREKVKKTYFFGRSLPNVGGWGG